MKPDNWTEMFWRLLVLGGIFALIIFASVVLK